MEIKDSQSNEQDVRSAEQGANPDTAVGSEETVEAGRLTPDQQIVAEYARSLREITRDYWNRLTPGGRRTWKVTAGALGAVAFIGVGASLGQGGESEASGTPEDSVTAPSFDDEPGDIQEASPPAEEEPAETATDEGKSVATEKGTTSRDDVHELLQGMEVPEWLTDKSIEAEQIIYRTIRNNEPEYREVTDIDDRQLWMWRGAVITRVGDIQVGENRELAWLRLDNPLEISIDEEIYWVAYHPTSKQLLAYKFGEYDGEAKMWTSEYLDTEPRPYSEDPFSGQQVGAKPLSYDAGGLTTVDAYEDVIRDNRSILSPTAFFYMSKDEAIDGLGEPLYFEEDRERIFRDYTIAEQRAEQDELLTENSGR